MGIKKWLQGLGLIAIVGAGDGIQPVRTEGTEEPARVEAVDNDQAYAEAYDSVETAQDRAGELKSEARERKAGIEVA